MAPAIGAAARASRGQGDKVSLAAADPRQEGAAAGHARVPQEGHRRTPTTSAPRFAEEARKIHYKEVEARGIYGEATGEEACNRSLEEGIEFQPLPSAAGRPELNSSRLDSQHTKAVEMARVVITGSQPRHRAWRWRSSLRGAGRRG